MLDVFTREGDAHVRIHRLDGIEHRGSAGHTPHEARMDIDQRITRRVLQDDIARARRVQTVRLAVQLHHHHVLVLPAHREHRAGEIMLALRSRDLIGHGHNLAAVEPAGKIAVEGIKDHGENLLS